LDNHGIRRYFSTFLRNYSVDSAITIGVETESPINSNNHAPISGGLHEHDFESSRESAPAIHPNSLALCSTPAARALISIGQALALKVLPMMVENTSSGRARLRIAGAGRAESEQAEIVRTLQFITGHDVTATWLRDISFEDAITKAYLGGDERIEEGLRRVSRSKAAVREAPQAPRLEECDTDIGKLLTTLFHFAAVRGASDLHLCPGGLGSIVKLRVDGALLIQNGKPYPRPVHDQLVARLKVLAGMDPSKRQIAQDGAMRFTLPNGRVVSSRISAIPTIHGESVVVRFMFGEKVPRLADIGLDVGTLRHLLDALRRESGLIILTGPTGSGKSTTLYACLAELKASGRNVITIEDPVEQSVDGVTQIQVSAHHDLDFAGAIRAALRHDPDALLIGELRDSESARAALSAASTGHLTLSSLHVGSALDVTERFSMFGVPRQEIIQQLLFVVNQRLLPKLCSQCKVIDLTGTRRFGTTIYQRVGCHSCSHTGYDGRLLVTEILNAGEQKTKEVLLKHSTKLDLLEDLPSGAWSSWMVSLQHLLIRGDISTDQFNLFMDEVF